MSALLDMPRVTVTTERAELFGTRYDVSEIERVEVREQAPESYGSIAATALIASAVGLAMLWFAGARYEGWWLVALGAPTGLALSGFWHRHRGRRPVELRITTPSHGPHVAAWIEDRTLGERIADAIERARRAGGSGMLGTTHG